LTTEWQTKVLAQFISCTAPDGKQQKALSQQAQRIKILKDDEDDEGQAPGENLPGSYEALMGGLGG
jgi:hypothetical protein